jgi:Ca-activated chloride channel family protein
MKFILVIFLLLSANVFAQRAASYISKGNEYYLDLQFDMAEAQFRQALDIDPKNTEARYNLANALMQQKKYKAAIEQYEGITTDNKNLEAASYYNAGVSYSKQKDLKNSIEAYKAALRINPTDNEARENLQKALSELKKQQNQQNSQNNKGGGGMNEKEADQKLKDLQQKEKDLQQKLQQGQSKGQGGGKDW